MCDDLGIEGTCSGCRYSGEGVFSHASEVTIEDSIIESNFANHPTYPGMGGGVFHCGGSDYLTIEDSWIRDNIAGYPGGGLVEVDSSATPAH